MIDKEYYSFSINSVNIGRSASYNSTAYPVFINSGNPISYFPESLLNHIILIFSIDLIFMHETIERNVIYGYCLLYDTIESVNELTNSLLPDILI